MNRPHSLIMIATIVAVGFLTGLVSHANAQDSQEVQTSETDQAVAMIAVSYTHLTLPTIYSV